MYGDSQLSGAQNQMLTYKAIFYFVNYLGNHGTASYLCT